jgi:transposase
VLPHEHAVLALDLADDKQVFALTDHDSRVLARKTVRCRPWQLAETIQWGLGEALTAGYTGVTLACEPTGHRWKVVNELARAAGIELVCVQPLLVHRAREAEDFTRDKSDDKDALLIARLATQLHVYLPERADPTWARLRHLGSRRVEQVTQHGAARQQLRDLLERACFALADLRHAQAQRDEVEALMVGVLDALDLTDLVTTIPGLSAVGAAAILAEAGDLTRFDSARAVVKHAGLCPRENASGTYAGKSTISGRGRPLLRVAAWRAVWGALPHNPVLAARHTHLTRREHNPLTDQQARTALAGSLLRQLFVVVITRTAWNPAIAAGHLDPRTKVNAPAA